MQVNVTCSPNQNNYNKYYVKVIISVDTLILIFMAKMSIINIMSIISKITITPIIGMINFKKTTCYNFTIKIVNVIIYPITR